MVKLVNPITIVLLGDIAAGKDTQAKILARKFEMRQISTGVFTRRHWGDPRFEQTKTGKLTPSQIIKDFLTKSISAAAPRESLLINGGKMPSEARLIYRLLQKQNRKILVIYLTLPEREIIRRLELRRRIEKRYDDDPRALQNRIAYYQKIYSRTVAFWKKKGVLRVINGKRSVSKVTKNIVGVIKSFYHN